MRCTWLVPSQIDLDTLEVAVQWQLDRHGTWPALALRKGNEPRATQLGYGINPTRVRLGSATRG